MTSRRSFLKRPRGHRPAAERDGGRSGWAPTPRSPWAWSRCCSTRGSSTRSTPAGSPTRRSWCGSASGATTCRRHRGSPTCGERPADCRIASLTGNVGMLGSGVNDSGGYLRQGGNINYPVLVQRNEPIAGIPATKLGEYLVERGEPHLPAGWPPARRGRGGRGDAGRPRGMRVRDEQLPQLGAGDTRAAVRARRVGRPRHRAAPEHLPGRAAGDTGDRGTSMRPAPAGATSAR